MNIQKNPLKKQRHDMHWCTVIMVMLVILLFYSADTVAQESDSSLNSKRFDCIAVPSEIVQIGSAVPGVIDTIAVTRNDLVKEGQIIVQLKSDVERTAVDSARARANITSGIEIRVINVEFSEQQEQRTNSLYSRKMVSEQDYKRLQTETKIAKLQLREAKDNHKLAYLNTLQTEAILDRLTILSPISGVITDVYKSRGEYVDNEPIFVVANIDTLNVELLVPVTWMGNIKKGMKAQVMLIPDQFGMHEATVTLVDKVADAPSGTFRVRLEVDNAQHELPAGLSCKIQFVELVDPPVIMSAQPVYEGGHHPAHDETSIPIALPQHDQ